MQSALALQFNLGDSPAGNQRNGPYHAARAVGEYHENRSPQKNPEESVPCRQFPRGGPDMARNGIQPPAEGPYQTGGAEADNTPLREDERPAQKMKNRVNVTRAHDFLLIPRNA